MSRVAEISSPVRDPTAHETRRAQLWCADQADRTDDPFEACRTALYALGLKADPDRQQRSATNPSKLASGHRKYPT